MWRKQTEETSNAPEERLIRKIRETMAALMGAALLILIWVGKGDWSRPPTAKTIVEYGFRSPIDDLNQANARFGAIESLLTLDSLGGPHQARREIIEGMWRNRVLRELGEVIVVQALPPPLGGSKP